MQEFINSVTSTTIVGEKKKYTSVLDILKILGKQTDLSHLWQQLNFSYYGNQYENC